MRFKRLSLKNFRPFVDEEIRFSLDEDRNITVIHGQNGSGKTTMLHAFQWVLFGDAESDHEFGRLPNQGKMSSIQPGERVEVRVKLDFIHDGVHYELDRWATFEKQSTDDFAGERKDEGVTLREGTDSGNPTTISNPNNRIQQFIPERLSNLFLFDGEYIDRLSGVDDQGEIKAAIQNIMGLEILERSIDHLEKVEGRFEDEMKEHGSEELQELIDQKRDLDDTIETTDTKIQTKKDHRKELQADIADINAKLEQIEDVAELQKERERLESREDEYETLVEQQNEELRQAISQKGYLPFAMGAIEETAKDLDRLRKEGAIPSELDNRLVEELLDDKTCICGRDLEPNTEPFQEVASYKSDDTPSGVDQAALRLISHIGTVQETREEFFETVEQKIERRNELETKLTDVREKLDEVSAEIGGFEGYDPETDESPQELEQRRQEKVEKRAQLKEQINQLQDDLEALEADRDDLNEEIEAARDEKQETELARKRMKAAGEVRAELEDAFRSLQQRVRAQSNERVKETFSSVATKSNYVAEISDDFELNIREGYGGSEVEVNKSRGERQIASLAFIGSLVSIAKQRYESDEEKSYFTGGIYPIVMDSPFGALDKQHRREISRVIPMLADQVIVFVTDSQWEGPVENEMSGLVGNEYELQYDDGAGEGSTPRTRINQLEAVPTRGD